MLTMDIATQIYAILKQPDLKYLTQVFFFLEHLFSYVLYFCIQYQYVIRGYYLSKYLSQWIIVAKDEN